MHIIANKMTNPEIYYNGIEKSTSEKISLLSRRTAIVSWARLAVVVITIIAIWWLWGCTQTVISAIVVGTMVFLALVKLHGRLFADITMQKSLKQVATDNKHRLKLELEGMDGGDEYIDPRHEYSYDLDLFGRHSIFALINATATPGGRKLLARNLTDPALIANDIERRQEAIRELSEMHEFRTRLQALGVVAGNENADIKKQTSDIKPLIRLKWWQNIALYLFPTAIAVLVLLAIIGFDVAIYMETAIVASILTAAAGAKVVGKVHADVEKIVNRVSVYHSLLNEIEKHRFSSPMLQELQRSLGDGNNKSSVIAHKLSRLLTNLDQRYNWLSYILLNATLQWDYRQVRNISKWMSRYSDKLDKWSMVLSDVDELCSLATFSFNNPGYTFPHIDRDASGVVIEALQLGHPLINNDRCICNDVRTMKAGNFMVVTGANMAGKSTYLRTVGVNYLLALIGAPVFATDMTIGIATLFTGLRTTDSLGNGESYFFAELRRLQAVVNRAAAGERMLVILDEILKGTNSADKQKGSLALVSKLVNMNVAGIIATHDLVLGTLADRFPDHVFNNCFEAEIDGDTLHFDYKLRPGVAQNLNAYFLMQHMGIV